MPTGILDNRLIDTPMLRENECASIAEQIYDLRARWITRGLNRFYTLGRASYLDMSSFEPADGAFLPRLRSDNYLLRSHFAPLYRAICEVLREILGGEVVITTEFAVPGFHIFKGEGAISAGNAPPHFDLQYQLLNWAEGKDEAEPISFTLPVRLPRAGGALEVWADSQDDLEARFRRGELKAIHEYPEKFGPGYFHRYSVGHLAVHLNRILHRIGAVADVRHDDERITFQGHGRKLDGVWQLYW
jgi:hypothetical protein